MKPPLSLIGIGSHLSTPPMLHFALEVVVVAVAEEEEWEWEEWVIGEELELLITIIKMEVLGFVVIVIE